jgi:hypothetical protein
MTRRYVHVLLLCLSVVILTLAGGAALWAGTQPRMDLPGCCNWGADCPGQMYCCPNDSFCELVSWRGKCKDLCR